MFFASLVKFDSRRSGAKVDESLKQLIDIKGLFELVDGPEVLAELKKLARQNNNNNETRHFYIYCNASTHELMIVPASSMREDMVGIIPTHEPFPGFRQDVVNSVCLARAYAEDDERVKFPAKRVYALHALVEGGCTVYMRKSSQFFCSKAEAEVRNMIEDLIRTAISISTAKRGAGS